MSVFEAASKFLVAAIDRKELHHVPSEIQAKRLNLLSVVEDGTIKEWKLESFKQEVYDDTLPRRTINFTETVGGTLGAELNPAVGFDLKKGSNVVFKAHFKKFALRNLENVDSLTQHLESGEFSTSINKTSSWWDYIPVFSSNTRSFKVVTSVLYTTSPTEITLTHQSESGGSAKVKIPVGGTIKAIEGGLKSSTINKPVIKLPSRTAIAYGCVDVSVDTNGKMKVQANDQFDGKVVPEESSNTTATRKTRGQKRKASESAGSSLPRSGDASSAEKIEKLEQEKAELQEMTDKLKQERDEVARLKQESDKEKEEVNKIKEEMAEELNTVKKEKSAIQQENDLLAEMTDQLKEEKAEGKRQNRETLNQRAQEIFQLSNDLNEKNMMIEEKNRTIEEKNRTIEEKNRTIEEKNRTIEEKKRMIEETNRMIKEKNKQIAELQQAVFKQVGDLRTELEDQRKKHDARFEALEKKPNPQDTTTTTKAVQEVPKPDSGSVELKLVKDDGDDEDDGDGEDDEVQGTESEGAVAKVGQGTSSTLNLQTGKRE